MVEKTQKAFIWSFLLYLEHYCTHNLIIPITIAGVNMELKYNFEDFQNISNDTLRREMKWRLKLSYKSVMIANRKLIKETLK